MYTYAWYHWLTFFFFYCFIGWIFESTYVSVKKGHFINRGFLRLPMLPLYGTGAVMMLWVSFPVKDNLLLVYLAGFIAATVLEYVTGYMMERLFKVRYWDYSNLPFNLHGYICLSSSVAWGFLTILMTEVLHKPVERFVLGMNPVVEFAFIGITGALFITDTIQSTREALNLARALETMTKMRTELEELQVQIALLKAEASQKVREMKEDQPGRLLKTAGSWKDATVQKLSDWRAEPHQHPAFPPELVSLTERLRELTENRQKLTHHISFSRKSILRRNPGATSRWFAEALKELRETINSNSDNNKTA